MFLSLTKKIWQCSNNCCLRGFIMGSVDVNTFEYIVGLKPGRYLSRAAVAASFSFGRSSNVIYEGFGHGVAPFGAKVALAVEINRFSGHTTIARRKPGIDTQLHGQLGFATTWIAGNFRDLSNGNSSTQQVVDRSTKGHQVSYANLSTAIRIEGLAEDFGGRQGFWFVAVSLE